MTAIKASTPNHSAPTPQRPSLLAPLIVAALAIPLLAGAWLAQRYAATIVGPLAIAAGPYEVAVVAPGVLYRLDHDGALLSTDTETIASGIRDAGATYVGGALFVSPSANDSLLRCVAEKCEPFTQDRYAPQGAIQTFFDGTYYWFSETDADRIQRYDEIGTRIDMPVSDLSSPGSIFFDDGHLFVADAGNRKISRYKVHKRGIAGAETFAEYSTGKTEDPINAPSRFLPLPDGEFLAIFSNATRTQGVLLKIDAEGETNPLNIEGLANPIGIAALENARLILDEGSMQVLRQDASGKVSVFGNEAFRAQLADQQQLRSLLLTTVPILFVLGVLASAIGGTWLLLRLTWTAIDPAIDVRPDSDGVIWLPAECDLAPKHIPRYLLIAAPVALIPAAALIASTPVVLEAVLWALLCFGLAAGVPTWRALRARLPKGERIGVRDRQLVVTHPEHGLREFPLPKVEWNEHLLRPEPGLDIPLFRNGISLYHQSSLEELLLPRLNLMRKI